MSDVAGIVLNSILKNPDESFEIFPRLKLQYFNSSYSEIFVSITKYYNKYSELPNFASLEMTVRDSNISKKIKALSLLEVSDDIDINIAVEALVNQFTQEETLDNLSIFVDKIPHYDSDEIILKLSEVVMHLEEVTENAEDIVLMDDIFIMDEESVNLRIPFTLNNTLDADSGGIELTNYVLIGGHRGSGKTVAACNIVANHYEMGDVSMLFTIEMRKREINNRLMSILSGVSNKSLRNMLCTPQELLKVARVRADFFADSEEVYQDFLKHTNFKQFEIDLVKTKKLKPDNQIVLIDNPSLTLADIDMNIQKFKQKHGDKLRTVVVDHLNRIVVNDKYDWKQQIYLSEGLKDLAIKHGVLMITQYQTDKSGEARFAKGILDPGDFAVNLINNRDYLNFKSTKTRGIAPFDFNAPIHWDTFKMSPEDAVIIEAEGDETETETARDAPWT